MADRDAAEMLLNLLKTSTDAKAVTIRDLLVYGAASIIETGDLRADNLTQAETRRREDSNPAKALYLTVQDAGENPTGQEGVLQQSVVVCIYDRRRGYSNIRAVRNAVRSYLRQDYVGNIDDGGMVTLRYTNRSGHRYDVDEAVEWEGLAFEATVMYLIDQD